MSQKILIVDDEDAIREEIIEKPVNLRHLIHVIQRSEKLIQLKRAEHLSRLRSTKTPKPAARSKLSLQGLIEEVVNAIRPITVEKNIKVVLDKFEGKSLLQGDRDKLEQVTRTLLIMRLSLRLRAVRSPSHCRRSNKRSKPRSKIPESEFRRRSSHGFLSVFSKLSEHPPHMKSDRA
ncbi:MAG: hypothetical protein ABGX83_06660 [Nitrospira sp.]